MNKNSQIFAKFAFIATLAIILAAVVFAYVLSRKNRIPSVESAVNETAAHKTKFKKIRENEKEIELLKHKKRLDIELQKERNSANINDLFERIKNGAAELLVGSRLTIFDC